MFSSTLAFVGLISDKARSHSQFLVVDNNTKKKNMEIQGVPQTKDELGEKVQKLFQDFLEEYVLTNVDFHLCIFLSE